MKAHVRRIAAAAGIVALGLSIASCDGGTTEPQETESVEYHTDYPSYASLDELWERADLVVVATVGRDTRVEPLSATVDGDDDPQANPNAGVDSPGAGPEPLVTTVFQADVSRVFKGGRAADAGPVEVSQLGGTHDGVTYTDPESVQLTPGSEYLLFLAVFPDSPASLLNPVQGQYPIGESGEPTALEGNDVGASLAELEEFAEESDGQSAD